MDIVERLKIADISYHPLNFDALKEIEQLRAELATVKQQRDELVAEVFRIANWCRIWGGEAERARTLLETALAKVK